MLSRKCEHTKQKRLLPSVVPGICFHSRINHGTRVCSVFRFVKGSIVFVVRSSTMGFTYQLWDKGPSIWCKGSCERAHAELLCYYSYYYPACNTRYYYYGNTRHSYSSYSS